MKSSQRSPSYLKPGRLADVMTMIQVLAFDPTARRSADGLEKQLANDPVSAASWACHAVGVLTPPLETRLSRVRIVSEFIRRPETVGTIDDPAAYFGGVLDMNWGPLDWDYRDRIRSQVIWFGGQTDRAIVGLGSSSRHLLGGSKGSAPASMRRRWAGRDCRRGSISGCC
jgi:hypothetical protein